MSHCGGPNLEFRREVADLHVLVLSPHNEAGGYNATYSVSQLQQLTMSAASAYWHAIAGDSGSSCAPEVDPRYAVVVQATGGLQADVCAPSYAPILQQLAGMLLNAPLRVRLQTAPVLATIAVKVGGTPCASGPKGWSFDAAARVVSITAPAAGGGCVATPGDAVVVDYKLICAP